MALSSLCQGHEGYKEDHETVNILRDPNEEVSDVFYFTKKISQLWVNGLKIDWAVYYETEERNRIPLPTYPFQRKRYWPNMDINKALELSGRKETRRSLDEWFYTPIWKQSYINNQPNRHYESEESIWMIFNDQICLGDQIVKRLQKEEETKVIIVNRGEEYRQVNEKQYEINEIRSEDYNELFSIIKKENNVPIIIVYLWNITEKNKLDLEYINKALEVGYYNLLYIVQGIINQDINKKIHLYVITNNLYEIIGQDNGCPEKALTLGPIKVIPVEYRIYLQLILISTILVIGIVKKGH